jgi:hypothetical protein
MDRKSARMNIFRDGKYLGILGLFCVKNLIIECKQKTLGDRIPLISRHGNRTDYVTERLLSCLEAK